MWELSHPGRVFGFDCSKLAPSSKTDLFFTGIKLHLLYPLSESRLWLHYWSIPSPIHPITTTQSQKLTERKWPFFFFFVLIVHPPSFGFSILVPRQPMIFSSLFLSNQFFSNNCTAITTQDRGQVSLFWFDHLDLFHLPTLTPPNHQRL